MRTIEDAAIACQEICINEIRAIAGDGCSVPDHEMFAEIIQEAVDSALSAEVTRRQAAEAVVRDLRQVGVELYSALKGMPFPPHMPDAAGNAMRAACEEWEKQHRHYLDEMALAMGREP